MKRARPRTLLPLLACLAGIVLLLVYAGPSDLAEALGSFDARFLPLLLLLAVADYALRFLRWHLLARLVTGRDLPAGQNLAVFLAANALLLAPARAGDFTRSVYARSLFGTPAATTAPVPVLERIVDVVIMGLLALAGVVAFGQSPFVGIAGLLLAVAAFAVLSSRPSVKACIAMVRRLAGDGLAAHATSFFETLASLWRPAPLLIAFGLGAIAWAIECIAFLVVLWGLGMEPDVALAGQSAFIYPVANLAGSLSMLPGGLGVAEGSIATLTASFTGAEGSTALAAAVIIRLVIVGFGVVTGLPGALYVAGRTSLSREAPEGAVATTP